MLGPTSGLKRVSVFHRSARIWVPPAIWERMYFGGPLRSSNRGPKIARKTELL
ncbi:hypothetical protein LguiB_007772 [Lonicera macranthoides]